MRGRTRTLTWILIAGVLGVACARKETPKPEAPALDPAVVRADIEAANARFVDALKKGDKAGALANYAPDALVMMPGEEAWRGTEGVDKGFSGFIDQFTLKEGSATTTDVMVAGHLAIETGTFAWTLTPKKGADVKDKGKYLTVWQHQADGSWKIIRDINNSDLPPQ